MGAEQAQELGALKSQKFKMDKLGLTNFGMPLIIFISYQVMIENTSCYHLDLRFTPTDQDSLGKIFPDSLRRVNHSTNSFS